MTADELFSALGGLPGTKTIQAGTNGIVQSRLALLRNPAVILPDDAAEAAEAMEVERSGAGRRALNEIRAELGEEHIGLNEAAVRVVELVDRLGLRAVAKDDVMELIDESGLGVVCWMAALPPGAP